MEAMAREQGRASGGEGLRVHTGGGWVYLVPLARRSALRVVGEGPDLEIAAELCDFYAGKVRELDGRAAATRPFLNNVPKKGRKSSSFVLLKAIVYF